MNVDCKFKAQQVADLENDPIFSIPPYKVEQVFATYSETMDWGLELMGVPGIWKLSKGEGAKVAILDTGIALEHPDLRDSIADAKDFTNSRSGPNDVQGHGTHVAGTVAARENSSGVIGVAPKALLWVAKVLGDNGSGNAVSIAQGIEWAINNKVHIISMSLGSSIPIPLIENAIKKAVKAGIFVICAAGNEGPTLGTVGYPARYKEAISVGSIDRRRRVSRFSSRGPQVDIVAPGDQILSCYPPKGLAKLSGTSMATPFVSGIVALKVARQMKFPGGDPINSQQELMKVLRESATDMHTPGHDSHYGYGILNPNDLMKYGAIPVKPPEDGSSHSALSLDPSDFSDSGRKKVQDFIDNFGKSDEIEIRYRLR